MKCLNDSTGGTQVNSYLGKELMFESRFLHTLKTIDVSGTKCYRISCDEVIDDAIYEMRLAEVKSAFFKERKVKDWSRLASFAIFHQGAQYPYLVLCWWDNGNELFTSVSVKTDDGWQQSSTKQEAHSMYSFCIYDMEIMEAERQFFGDLWGQEYSDIGTEIDSVLKSYRHSWYHANPDDSSKLRLLMPQIIKIQPCNNRKENQGRLEVNDIEQALCSINKGDLPDWHLLGNKLYVEYQFDSFLDAFGFVGKVAELSEEVDHHPKIIHDFKHVRLEITSYDFGYITKRDLDFARKCNELSYFIEG